MAVEPDNALSHIWAMSACEMCGTASPSMSAAVLQVSLMQICMSAFGHVAKLYHSGGSAISTMTLHSLYRSGVYLGHFSSGVVGFGTGVGTM
eukprot:7685354-Ditylum_brightwellii.AAC.1